MLPSNIWYTLENVNPLRLSQDPYPEGDRPRGQRDLDSVKFHRRIIRKKGNTSPIWIAKKGNRYIILDGVHRLVASNLEHKRSIPCHIVHVDV
jgi:ParB-like chromosome segregation protein Spo0J